MSFKSKINYASPGTPQPRGRVSRQAVMAVPVGLVGFPLLPHWIFESELQALSHTIAVPPEKLLLIFLYLWPSVCVTFCVITFFRIILSKGRLRGNWLVGIALIFQAVGILITIVLCRLFSFR
jgi:hypothetical protein